ncbi:FHIPEP family type III secretion protein [Aquiflexum lacus]|uniref:FHIPEP family type III secretion protein n=1 Tax=Aquiflexum lacus TaxID=2483805 RepID=UPI001896362E|nr:FHIPEP family type III secretion protein [Aquiflexum lacus]
MMNIQIHIAHPVGWESKVWDQTRQYVQESFVSWITPMGLVPELFRINISQIDSFSDCWVSVILEEMVLQCPVWKAHQIATSVSGKLPEMPKNEKELFHDVTMVSLVEKGIYNYFVGKLVIDICQENIAYFATKAVCKEILRGHRLSLDDLKITDDELIPIFCKLMEMKSLNRFIERLKDDCFREALRDKLAYQNDPIEKSAIAYNHCGTPEFALHIGRQYLRQLPIGSFEEEFKALDQELFFLTGIDFPDIKIILDDKLIHHQFSVSVNGYPGLTQNGISPEKIYERIYSDTQTQFIGFQSSTADTSDDFSEFYLPINFASYNIQQLNAIQFIATHIKEVLYLHAPLMITVDWMAEQMENHGKTYPTMKQIIQSQYEHGFLAEIFCRLIAEGISLRNFHVILQAIIDFDWVLVDDRNYLVFDERISLDTAPKSRIKLLEAILAFSRTRLANFISFNYAGNHQSVFVYTLDIETENKLVSILQNEGNMAARDYFFQKVEDLINNTKLIQGNINIITTTSLRTLIRSALIAKFPQINVISFQEMAKNANIQIVDRV